MKKTTRAAIAGVAGLGLLAGGATFALWNDSADVPGATIASGTLTLNSLDDGQWVDVTGGGSTNIEDIGAYRVVPGSELQYTAGYEIAATGDNLSAVLATTGVVDPGSESALDEAIDVTSTFTLAGGELTTDITSANDGEVVAVTVDVSVSEGLVGTNGQDEVSTLGNGSVTLTQTTPTQ